MLASKLKVGDTIGLIAPDKALKTKIKNMLKMQLNILKV